MLDERPEPPLQEKDALEESDDMSKAEFKHDHSKERLVEETKTELSRQRQNRETGVKKQPYIEHMINHEGGTITILGVHLSVADDALSDDHIIAVTVIHDPDIHLPGNARRGRMTPLIKKPQGLKLSKPAKLIVPHSAIIPEPDRHGIIVFTGQEAQGEVQKGKNPLG